MISRCRAVAVAAPPRTSSGGGAAGAATAAAATAPPTSAETRRGSPGARAWSAITVQKTSDRPSDAGYTWLGPNAPLPRAHVLAIAFPSYHQAPAPPVSQSRVRAPSTMLCTHAAQTQSSQSTGLWGIGATYVWRPSHTPNRTSLIRLFAGDLATRTCPMIPSSSHSMSASLSVTDRNSLWELSPPADIERGGHYSRMTNSPLTPHS